MEHEQALAQLSRFVVTLGAHQSFEVSVPHLSHGTLLLPLHPFSSQTVCVSARQRSSPAETDRAQTQPGIQRGLLHSGFNAPAQGSGHELLTIKHLAHEEPEIRTWM